MAPLMMHHAFPNFPGGGNGNMQGQQQQLHVTQHQLPPHWNNHTIQKRSNYLIIKLE